MSRDVLLAAFSQIFAAIPQKGSPQKGSLKVVWHAGEPLVLPVDYYRDAFSIIESVRPHQLEVSHGFQTNGILIDERWCEFIRQQSIHLAVSIDGPRAVHDRFRQDRKGRGTFDNVMQGIELLRAWEIPFHVIAVLTRSSLDDPDGLYGFFSELGPQRVAFNLEEIEGVNGKSTLCYETARQEFYTFLSRYASLAGLNQGHAVRELQDMCDRILFPAESTYNDLIIPFRIVSVAANGDFSTFSPELLSARHPGYGDFVFGNFLRDRLEAAVSTEKLRRVQEAIQSGVHACRATCDYFTVCGGGAPSNKLWENGRFDSTETMYCRLGIKTVADVVVDQLGEGIQMAGRQSGIRIGR
jgi:uncharacterized protein